MRPGNSLSGIGSHGLFKRAHLFTLLWGTCGDCEKKQTVKLLKDTHAKEQFLSFRLAIITGILQQVSKALP